MSYPLPDNVVDNLRAKGHVVTDSILDAVIQAVSQPTHYVNPT